LGLRLVAVDRPGYGLSQPRPGRTIADWVPDALAVADHLGLDELITVGVSTGGAYALAVGALAPERTVGVIPTCSLTDMRYAPARATVSVPHAVSVWDAPDRPSAIAAAIESHGLDGSRIFGPHPGHALPELPAADLALIADPTWMAGLQASGAAMFAWGLEGYADDRIADGGGWTTFDPGAITCPVVVLHGAADVITDPIHARHTADVVPTATLDLVAEMGHFSIEQHIPRAIEEVLSAPGA
jgi:pimeloyl-ACP methyl ester carboxylesterase